MSKFEDNPFRNKKSYDQCFQTGTATATTLDLTVTITLFYSSKIVELKIVSIMSIIKSIIMQ